MSSRSAAESGIRTALAQMRLSESPSRILNATEIASSFEQAPYASRADFGVYDERIRAANGTLSQLATRSAQFSGDMQGRFSHAMNDVNLARARLERSLNAAENATPESWDHARAALARDYRDYADAVTHAESIGSA